MNAHTFFLLSAFICGAICVAPCYGQLDIPSPFNPGSLLNLTTGIMQLFENNALELQENVISQLRNMFQLILNEICFMFGGLINTFNLPLRAWCQPDPTTANPRDRRSLIPIPNLIPPPFQAVLNQLQSVNLTELIQNPLGTLTNGAVTEIENVLNSTIPAITSFISTELLPQTRRFLDSLQRSNQLPANLSLLIQNFDLVYNILQGLGYVSPVSS